MILIATGSLRATWLPEGLNKSFVCTHILKISYETVVFVSFTFSVLLVCFLRLILHLFVFVSVLEGQTENLKIAGVDKMEI